MAKFRTPRETALLLAAMLKRSGENYATVSQNTLSRISNRKRSGQAFTDAVEHELGAFGIALIPVSIHSYGLMRLDLFKTCLQITPESCATISAELDAAPDAMRELEVDLCTTTKRREVVQKQPFWPIDYLG